MEEDEKEEVMGEVREGVGVRVGDDQGACKLDEPPPPPPPPPNCRETISPAAALLL